MRAELVTADRTEVRRWDAWVCAWNDSVAEAFAPRSSQRSRPDGSADGIERRDADSEGLSWLIAICCAFTALGVLLMALVDGTLDLGAAWAWWDSTAGRTTTAISGIGGLLGIVAYFRNRSTLLR